MKTAIALLACLVLLPFLFSERESGFMFRPQPLEERAREIWSGAQPAISQCLDNRPVGDMALANALIAIELDRTNQLERLVEEALIRTAMSLGFSPPDLSVGPAQIRLSTAGKLLGEDYGRKQTVDALFEPCKNLNVARRLIKSYRARCASPAGHTCRTIVARRYNGQRAVNQANLAYLHVFEAVYSISVSQHQRSWR